MNQPRSINIITAYHFPASETQAYQRLLNSVRSSIREIGDRGHLILVANGTNDGAEPLEDVIQAIGPARRELVVPVALERNVRNVGGLNAGIKMLIEHLGLTDNSLVGLVQPSMILQPGWLSKLEIKLDGSENDAAFGRIVDEWNPSRIWADGHLLKNGKTYPVDSKKSVGQPIDPVVKFPCLSAALFGGNLVKSIVRKYGEFVFAGLEHYGDCTDVALRAKAAANATFQFCEDAVATKRWPITRQRVALTSQIVVAGLYYQDRQKEATERIKNSSEAAPYFVDATSVADKIMELRYSATGQSPPSAGPLEVGCWL